MTGFIETKSTNGKQLAIRVDHILNVRDDSHSISYSKTKLQLKDGNSIEVDEDFRSIMDKIYAASQSS